MSNNFEVSSGASAARQMHKIREEYQLKLNNIEGRVRKEVEDNLKKRTGKLYKQIEAEITDRLTREHTIREIDLEAMRSEFEEEYEAKVKAKHEELDQRFQTQFIEAAGDFSLKLSQARQAWGKEHMVALQEKTAEYAEKARALEELHLGKEIRTTQEHTKERGTLVERMSATLNEAVSNVDNVLGEKKKDDLELMSKRINKLEQLHLKLHTAVKDDGSKQQFEFIKALKRVQELDTRARDYMLEGYDTDLQVMHAAITEERTLNTESSSRIVEAHQRQLNVMQDMVKEQQREFDRSLKVMEDTLGAKYTTMLKSLQDQVQLEQEVQVMRAVGALVRTARVEAELSRQAINDQQRAEDAAAAKFQGMVSDMRQQWDEEEQLRIRDVEQRFRSHYEHMMTNMRAQVEMALQLHAVNDQQCMKDVSNRFKKQMDVMNSFKDKCQRLYADRLTEYAELSRKQFASFEQSVLEQSEATVSSRHQSELRLRRMKKACSKWRHDYQKHTQARVQEALALLETRYMHEIDSTLAQLSEAREAAAEKELAKCRAEREFQDELLVKQEREQETRRQEEARALGKAESHKVFQSLCKLWQETDTSSAQQVKALKELFYLADFTPELLEGLRVHHERQKAVRPLLRLCYHRDQLLKKLGTVDAILVAARGGQGAAKAIKKGRRGERITGTDKTITEAQNNRVAIMAELQTFSFYLGKVLEQYENIYNTEFWHNSEWLLKRLRTEYREYSIRTGHDSRNDGYLAKEWEDEIREVEKWLKVAKERKASAPPHTPTSQQHQQHP